MSEIAVRVKGLGKEYRLSGAREGYSTLRDRLAKLASAPVRALRGRSDRTEQKPLFWALKDVSFEVRTGEVIGVIGRNGAGKSTLLKILSRITEPTRGEIDINGRVGSLLEVGTGFHPELTGRENVYLNGAILGMRRAEIALKFDEIVAFAEVEKFIETPVKHYSSGMYMRLAFAVAAHLEPEILIVDEVLAVGDAAFQKKCLGKMSDVAKDGRTVLFVSHNMAAIETLCSRVCLIHKGAMVCDGSPRQAAAMYSDLNQSTRSEPLSGRITAGPLSFTKVGASLEGEQPDIRLIVDLELTGSRAHSPAVDLLDDYGITFMQALPSVCFNANCATHQVRFMVDLPPLVPGRYSANIWVGPHNTSSYDRVESAFCFEIATSPVPERTFPHTRNHGWIVAPSRILTHKVQHH
jgi:lipopolysaccharide transport system ATP-binding protein